MFSCLTACWAIILLLKRFKLAYASWKKRSNWTQFLHAFQDWVGNYKKKAKSQILPDLKTSLLVFNGIQEKFLTLIQIGLICELQCLQFFPRLGRTIIWTSCRETKSWGGFIWNKHFIQAFVKVLNSFIRLWHSWRRFICAVSVIHWSK